MPIHFLMAVIVMINPNVSIITESDAFSTLYPAASGFK